MKFIIDRASDWGDEPKEEIEIWTTEELMDFIEKSGHWLIIWGWEKEDVVKYNGDELECNKYTVREKTWRVKATIYDDYLE